jgi:hypothetical protein
MIRRIPSYPASSKRRSEVLGASTYVSSYTTASPELDTWFSLRRTSEASARRLDSTTTATQRRAIIIENIDARRGVAVPPDV